MTDRRPVHVCDHALLRFIERVGGLDVEAMRRHLSESLDRAVVAAEAIGCREIVVVADDNKYVIVKGRVITVLAATMKSKRVKRGR
jgi:hypothetical protein